MSNYPHIGQRVEYIGHSEHAAVVAEGVVMPTIGGHYTICGIVPACIHTTHAGELCLQLAEIMEFPDFHCGCDDGGQIGYAASAFRPLDREHKGMEVLRRIADDVTWLAHEREPMR